MSGTTRWGPWEGVVDEPPSGRVFLVDVDNTLIDNDRIAADTSSARWAASARSATGRFSRSGGSSWATQTIWARCSAIGSNTRAIDVLERIELHPQLVGPVMPRRAEMERQLGQRLRRDLVGRRHAARARKTRSIAAWACSRIRRRCSTPLKLSAYSL